MTFEYPKFEKAPKGLYRHYKGHLYRVVAMAVHSETLEPMVIYESVTKPHKVWARPLSMWDEAVTVNGIKVSRFQKVDEQANHVNSL